MVKEQSKDFVEEKAWLSSICENQSTKELKNKYDTWAINYDADVQEDWSFMPVAIAKKLSQLLPDKNCSILDAGAGTGLVGEALAKEGYTNLTAVDLSEQMLAIAKEKKVYKNLLQGNLEDSTIFSNFEKFDVIVSAGVFAYAHAGIEALNNLFTFLKEEGLFLLTIRENYRQEMQTGFNQLSWQLIHEEICTTNFPICDDHKIFILAFKKQ